MLIVVHYFTHRCQHVFKMRNIYHILFYSQLVESLLRIKVELRFNVQKRNYMQELFYSDAFFFEDAIVLEKLLI